MAPQVTFQYLLLLGYLWATGFPGPTLWAFFLLSPTGAALPGTLACRDQGASLARENHLEGDLHAVVLRGHSGSVLKKDGEPSSMLGSLKLVCGHNHTQDKQLSYHLLGPLSQRGPLGRMRLVFPLPVSFPGSSDSAKGTEPLVLGGKSPTPSGTHSKLACPSSLMLSFRLPIQSSTFTSQHELCALRPLSQALGSGISQGKHLFYLGCYCVHFF